VSAPKATVLLRVMAGGVFVSEGILKFLYGTLGAGRFAKLGFPAPVFTASFVGTSRSSVACCPFWAYLRDRWRSEMIVAILSTKISLYLGTSPLPPPPVEPVRGLAGVLHDSRSELAQLLTAAFLVAAGPGPLSVDAWLQRHTRSRLFGGASPGMSASRSGNGSSTFALGRFR
jgi:uncharacterized membrane protein YphA (DoxX/SURF4 family)